MAATARLATRARPVAAPNPGVAAILVRDDRVVAYAQVATLHSSSDEARARVLRFLDSDPASELEDIRLMRSVADAEALIPDTYESRLIAHVFSEDAR